MDRIVIRDLLVRCVLGVGEEERRERQDVLVSVTLHVDLRRPGRSDSFEETVDYRGVNKRVLAVAEASSFHLVEALAEAIARVCLETGGVEAVEVSVEKPGALRFARSVAVELTRLKEDP